MVEAFVVSAAMTPISRYADASYAGLAAPTLSQALAEAGVARSEVQALYCGHSFGGILVGQRVAKEIGLGGIPVVNVENACSSGATALHAACRAVRDEHAEVVCVVGVDKLSQFGRGMVPLVGDDWEVRLGMVMPALYAMRARRLLHERSIGPEDLALVTVKARRHGGCNPFAQLRDAVTVEEVLASRMIADPLTLLQCCPTGDGAAAVVVVSEAVKRRLGPGIRVRASVLRSGRVVRGFRDMLRATITSECAAAAFEEAEMGPRDLDVVELHDAFTVAELLYYEALGLAGEGEAHELLRRGGTTYGGDVVVNPSGGLLAKGHPIGATGVAQVAEVFWQLTGRAGARQVDAARTAMTHATGGGVTGLDHGACTIHVFEKAA